VKNLRAYLDSEKTFSLGLLCIAAAYFIEATPYIGTVGHYGSINEIAFILICAVIFIITKRVVEHAEFLANYFGEPYGTLVLILSASAIEVIMVVTIMLHGPTQEPTLARDAVFAGVILSMNAVLGVALLIGGVKFMEQEFNQRSAYSYITKLGAMCALGMFIPMVVPPNLLSSYKIFVIIVFMILYGFFLSFQVGSYSYFFSYEKCQGKECESQDKEDARPGLRIFTLIAYLVVIGILVEFLSISVDDSISYFGLPNVTAALIVAVISKAPESLAVLRATMRNDMQLVINIALSSALSTMGLTVPIILIVGLIVKMDVVIALTQVQALLLVTTITLAYMNQSSGRTNAYGGTIQLSLFFAYLFTLFF